MAILQHAVIATLIHDKYKLIIGIYKLNYYVLFKTTIQI